MKINTLEAVETIGIDGKKYQRQPVITYCRPMGYIAPVQNFNIGKRQEYKDRTWFTEDKVNNSSFIRKRSTQNA